MYTCAAQTSITVVSKFPEKKTGELHMREQWIPGAPLRFFFSRVHENEPKQEEWPVFVFRQSL